MIRAWLRAPTVAEIAEQHMLEAEESTTSSKIKKKKRNSVGGEAMKASRFRPY